MSDLDATFELLSSMSPKLKTKKSKKSPHKLAVKNRIRRSSIFDKTPHSHHVRDTSVIIIDDSILSDHISPKQVKQVKIIKTPIIISSTSSEASSEASSASEEEQEKIENPVQQSKFNDINNWLAESENIDGYSDIPSFESESDDSDKLLNNKNLGEQKSPSGVWKVVSIETKLGKEPLRIHDHENEDDEEIFPKPSLTNITNIKIKKTDLSEDLSKTPDNKSETSETEVEDIAAKLLDDLYGTSWRENKAQILSKTEPRPRKPSKPSTSTNRLLKTEKKSKKPEESSTWSHRLKKICDSDTNSSGSSESFKSAENPHCKKLNFSDSEDDSNFCSNMTPASSTSKITKTKSRSSSSSHSSIDFNESLNDSLGTRVKKRLAKKANTNTTNNKVDKNTQKKTDNITYDDRKCSFLKSLSGGIPPWQCDTDAHYYKTNFKTKKISLAKKLFALYNEKIFQNAIPEETPLEWNDRMRGTAGYCYNKRVTKPDGRVLRSCRIVLATKILDTADRLRDTLVHEMCHAATWLVNNVSDGHGQYWKSWAHKALKAFPELPPIKRCHDYQINTKYTYKCVDCGYSIGRHSKSLDIERKRCGYCFGKFEIFINKVNKHGEKQSTLATPKGKTTGFALFVKENYNSVKCGNMKHGDVMKVLGQKFSELKVIQKDK